MPHTSSPPGATATSKPRRRDPKGTRERLVRAALELFTTQGYHESTTPQVASRAGVAEGTIYRHFSSKEQLLNEIYRGAVHLFTQVVKDVPGQVSCRERMAEIARRWSDVAHSDPPLVKLVFVAPPHSLLDEKSHDVHEAMRLELERVVASGKSSGEIRPGPAYLWTDVWLQLVRLMLERIANQQWAADHSAPRQVVDSAWDAIASAGQPLPSSPEPTAAGLPLGQ